jgi:methanogenic corrinoid protein MtbC1
MSGTATPHDAVLGEYLAALRAGNRRAAFEVVDRAAATGLQLGDVYMDVFQPALREIGRLWQENEISVADEHLATAITQAAMVRLFERSFEWSDEARPSILAACGDTERHEVGLRMLCDMLEARGWTADYLGASVPVESLVQMVTARRPTVVALSVALAPHVPRLRTMITALRTALGDATPLIIAGGRPLLEDPSLAAHVGADLTAPNAADAVRLLEARVG